VFVTIQMHNVLVYHTISSPETALPSNIDLSPERFESHLRWLSRRRDRVVPLSRLLDHSQERLFAITFDDGYRDNLTAALPLLERYEMPATIFMVAGLIGEEGYLTAEDLRTLSAHPLITIGSHTLNHRHLTRISANEARHEISESKRVLEEVTGRKVDLLAYPYGDANPAIEALSEDCGYRAAWSVWNGLNTRYSLWRVPISRNDSLLRFIAKTSPAYFPIKLRLRPPMSGRPAPIDAVTAAGEPLRSFTEAG
jgi:peptidoglycan/xylan/chitin deacetylase (PgdA/CDA1 family)